MGKFIFYAASALVRRSGALALLLALSACVHTPIAAKNLPAEVLRLNALNERTLRVQVLSEAQETAGRQYLAFIIPMGRVTVTRPEEHVWNAAVLRLALAGIRVAPGADRSAPELRLTVSSLRLNAFDFLVTRRVAAEVEVRASWQEREASASGRFSEIRKMGFAPELSGVLERATAIAVGNVLKEIGLLKSSQ